MSQELMDRLDVFLLERGLRLTGQRRLISQTFFRKRGHVSTEELHHEVQKSDSRIGYATVSRTIKLLTEAGLAAGRSFGENHIRYEPREPRRHHDHLICTRCGKIVEFENDRIEALQKMVGRKHGFRVTDHKMELYGTCRSCRGR